MTTYRFSSRKYLVIASLIALAVFAAGPIAAAGSNGPGVQVVVKGSLPSALAHLKKMVAGNGMMVMGELHQGKVLSMTGLAVESETVFVGNPTVGKKLFSAEPGVGLVVPVRINLYVNKKGQTVASYVPPSQVLAAFHNAKVDMVAQKLDAKLGMMMKMLAK